MKRYLPSWRSLSFFFFYFFIIFYTFTFPGTVTWFIFYTFTLVLLIAFLSTRLTIKFKDINWKVQANGKVDLLFKITPRWSWLFMLSSLKFTLLEPTTLKTVYSDAFFRRMIQVHFDPFSLTRGQYNHLSLEVEGYGLFGIFNYYSKQNLPVLLSIFPEPLSKSNLISLMDNQSINSNRYNPFSNHEFQVKEIRTYQTRDSLSSIDWKSSLKREQWMIKEYETEEIKPIILCFLGSPSLQFEQLLSLTYSLYQYLSVSHDTIVHLIGDFEGITLSKNNKGDFLTIQPSTNTQKIKQLINNLDYKAAQVLIVKPSDLTISSPSFNQSVSSTVLTENHLKIMKGERFNE